MSEQNAPEAAQEATEGMAPEANQTDQQENVQANAEAQEATDTQDDTQEDPAAHWREAKKKADREAKNLRERLQAYEQAEEERKQAAMSDLERVQSEAEKVKAERETLSGELDEAYAQIARMTEEQEIRGALSEADIKPNRMKAAMRLVDFDSLDVDDDGNITGVKEAIKALKKEAPEFFRGSDDVSGPTNPPGEPPAANQSFGNMSSEEFEKYRQRVLWGERVTP